MTGWPASRYEIRGATLWGGIEIEARSARKPSTLPVRVGIYAQFEYLCG